MSFLCNEGNVFRDFLSECVVKHILGRCLVYVLGSLSLVVWVVFVIFAANYS